jgi:hypothetical protein
LEGVELLLSEAGGSCCCVLSCRGETECAEGSCNGETLASKDETMAALMPVPESHSAQVRVDSLEEQPLVVKYLTLNCLRHPIWQSLRKAELGSKVSVVLMRVA